MTTKRNGKGTDASAARALFVRRTFAIALLATHAAHAPHAAHAAESAASTSAATPFDDSQGRLLSPPAELPGDWAGVRALGMGNAFTTVGNDELAVFSNPAGLSRSRNPRSKGTLHSGAFPGLALGGNQRGLEAIGRDSAPRKWSARLLQGAAKSPGEAHRVEAQAFPFVTFGGAGGPTYLIGVPVRSVMEARSANVTTGAAVSSGSSARTMLFSETTGTAALGVAGSSRAGSLSWGLSARPNVRYTMLATDYANTDPDPKTLKSDVQGKALRTSSVGVDAGVLVTAADFWFPTLGLAVRNIPTGCVMGYVNPNNGKETEMCGAVRRGASATSFTDSATGRAIVVPSSLVDPTELRAGFSITPRGRINGTKVNLRLAVDAYPIPVQVKGKTYGAVDASISQLLHAGAELYLGNALIDNAFALRAGVQDSGLAFGFSFMAFGAVVEGARYVVKTGLAEQRRFDVRYLLGLSTGW